MSKKDLSLKAQPFGHPDCWYYEELKGIEIIYSPPNQPAISIIIPWRKLKVSLKRLEK